MQKSRVAVVRCADYQPGRLRENLVRGLDMLGGLGTFIKPDQKVLLKPNLFAAMPPDRAQTTHPNLVGALCSLVEEMGAHAFVGDNPVFGFRNWTYRRTGMTQVQFETGAHLVDLSQTEERSFPEGRMARRFLLPTNFTDFDCILSLPKLKAHTLMGISAAVKNSYGLVHGKGQRKRLHLRHADADDFAQMLLDLNTLVQPDLVATDAVIASDGEGPRKGRPKYVGALIMGADALAVDFVLAKIVDISPQRIGTLAVAMNRAEWADPYRRVEVVGDSLEEIRCEGFRIPEKRGGFVNALPRFLRNALIRHSKHSGG